MSPDAPDNSSSQPDGFGPTVAPQDGGAGTLIAGRYKLLEQIGEGGMGTVWMAEQRQPVRRLVAVKLIKAGMDSKAVLSRFEAERQALALMDHPNIAKVFDGGTTENGRPFFVMEYVKGVPLTAYCDDARLSIDERLALFVAVSQAVQHAHQKGIIHRDLKPSNILVCLYDGKPIPKIIDFGLAKAVHQPLTEHTLYTAHGVMMGTPLYMSPEQAEFNNLDVDTRTDIYSLGVILYELLTGTTPLEKYRFREAAWHEMLRLIKDEEPPRPSARLSGSQTLPRVAAQRQLEPVKLTKVVRGELDWIVMKCLEKERSRRYQTANGLARDVERYLADEAVEACPPSLSYRLRKFARKNRVILATTATIVLLLLAGITVSAWQGIRATRAEEQAIEDRNHARAAEQEARNERDRVIAEKKRADDNFALARKAVDDYLSRVADDPELKDRTDFTSLRKRLLESALPFYEQFARQLGDDPQSRAESGRLFLKLAHARVESGDLAGAVTALRQARDIYRQLAVDAPRNFEYRSSLVTTTNDLAYWEMRTERHKEASQNFAETLRLAEQLVTEFAQEPKARYVRAKVYMSNGRLDEAIRDLRALVRDHPGAEDYLSLLSGALDNSSHYLVRSGRQKEAERAMSESVALDRKLLEAQPKDPERRHRLANALFNQGAHLHNRPAEALPLRQEAGSILRQLVVDFPSNVRYRHMLARNQNAVGILLVKVRQPGDAVPALRESVLLMEQLPVNYPFPAVHRWRLAEFTLHLAIVLESLDRWDDAAGLVERSLHLLTEAPSQLKDAENQLHAYQALQLSVHLLLHGHDKRKRSENANKILEKVFADLRAINETEFALWIAIFATKDGRHKEATAVAESVVSLRPNEAGQLYDAACVYSVASAHVGKDAEQGEKYAKRSMELLKRAVDSGYQNVAHLKKDDDLAPLRNRKDYKEFVTALEAKYPPKDNPEAVK